MILQDEITTVVEAAEANMIGAVLFFALWSIFGMFLIFLLLPSRRNSPNGKRIMAFLLGISMLLIGIGIFNVWPEFQALWMNDAGAALGGLAVAIVTGALLLPSLVGLALTIFGTIFFIRGGFGAQ